MRRGEILLTSLETFDDENRVILVIRNLDSRWLWTLCETGATLGVRYMHFWTAAAAVAVAQHWYVESVKIIACICLRSELFFFPHGHRWEASLASHVWRLQRQREFLYANCSMLCSHRRRKSKGTGGITVWSDTSSNEWPGNNSSSNPPRRQMSGKKLQPTARHAYFILLPQCHVGNSKYR